MSQSMSTSEPKDDNDNDDIYFKSNATLRNLHFERLQREQTKQNNSPLNQTASLQSAIPLSKSTSTFTPFTDTVIQTGTRPLKKKRKRIEENAASAASSLGGQLVSIGLTDGSRCEQCFCCKNGWVYGLPGEPVQQFAGRLPPSKVPPGTFQWIAMRAHAGAGGAVSDSSGISEAAEEAHHCLAMLRQETSNRASAARVYDMVDTLVKRSELSTVGKWLLRIGVDWVDWTWRSLAQPLQDGQLGPACKVTAGNDGTGQFIVCVYTRDFRDRQDVGRVLQTLRQQCNIKQQLSYKADVYTELFPSSQQTDLPVSLWTSKWNSIEFARPSKWNSVGRIKK